MLPIHIFFGGLSALVAFPIAAFSKKGSRPHVAAGRSFVAGYVLVCITGLVLEAERTTGGTIRLFGAEFKLVEPLTKDSDHLPPIYILATTTLDLVFLYFAISGWRIWARARAAERGVFPRFDSVLAAMAMVVAVTFGVAFWLVADAVAAMPTTPNSAVFPHVVFTLATGIFLLDAGHDLYIGLARRTPRAWWVSHARKMVFAEMFLAAGIPFRCANLDHVGFWTLVTLIVVAMIGLGAAWRHHRRLGRETTAGN